MNGWEVAFFVLLGLCFVFALLVELTWQSNERAHREQLGALRLQVAVHKETAKTWEETAHMHQREVIRLQMRETDRLRWMS